MVACDLAHQREAEPAAAAALGRAGEPMNGSKMRSRSPSGTPGP
jgi:hypothetical protein